MNQGSSSQAAVQRVIANTPLLSNFPQISPNTSHLIICRISILLVLQATTSHMASLLQSFKVLRTMEIGCKVLQQAFKLVSKIQCTHLIKCLDLQPVDLYLGCNMTLLEGLQVTSHGSESASPCPASQKQPETVDVQELSDSSDEPRRGTRVNWTEDDNTRLMSYWLSNSVDPIKGNDKKSEHYWKAVAQEINNNMPSGGHYKEELLPFSLPSMGQNIT